MKKRAKKTKWVKRRHARVFAFLRVVMRPFCRLRYGFRAERCNLPKGSYLIVSNHQMALDQFFLSLSFSFPIYFIASDDIFNLKISPLIEYLVAPIPKSKSFADITAIMNVFRVIKEGGAVGVCPEGNRTISGGQWEMGDAIAKLAKSLKVPLVIHNVCGGYGTDPRWGHGVRKGRMRGFVRRVVSAEELAALSVEEVFTIIKNELTVDDTQSGIAFRSRKRAEYIERALYLCPQCGGVSTIVSRKAAFRCKQCNCASTYTPYLKISPPVRQFDRIYEWFEWEREEIVNKVLAGEAVSDKEILFRESVKFQKKKKLAGDRVAIDAHHLTVSHKDGQSVYPLDEISALTMLGKKKFNFYHGGKILQVKGGKRFCAIKYVHIFEGLRQRRSNSDGREL